MIIAHFNYFPHKIESNPWSTQMSSHS